VSKNLIRTKQAAEILGYKSQSSVFRYLKKPDVIVMESSVRGKRKVAYWDIERVKNARGHKHSLPVKEKIMLTCIKCYKRFSKTGDHTTLCPACRNKQKTEDPYGVMQQEKLAMSRICKHPGCTNHPPISGMYCYEHRGKYRHRFEDAGRSLLD